MFSNGKKLRAAFCMLIVLFVATAISAPCFAAGTARDAVNSVALVSEQYTYSVNGTAKSVEAWGSGFAIGKVGKPVQYIATNYHIIKDADLNNGTIQVCFSAPENDIVQVQVYWKDADKDLAILKLPDPTTKISAMALRMNKDIDYNDTYSALGYPLPITSTNALPQYDKSNITITRGNISTSTRINETNMYISDLKIDQGNSGGPLVNSRGEVVGINTFGITGDAGSSACYAIQIDELVENVDTDVIPLTLYGDITTSTIIYIACGVLALLIIIALVIFVIKKRKRQKVMQIEDIQTQDEPAPYQQTVAQAILPVTIMGITGHFTGQSFHVENKLIFGRDNNKCNVVFPLDQPGISGTHCEITADSDGAYINDLESSYGTFLGNGIKLTPRQPVKLNNGETFYLADEESKFEVRIGLILWK